MTNDPTTQTRGVEFWVPEIYLLHRDGSNGHFYRVADLHFGLGGDETIVDNGIRIHDPPVRFVDMPAEEAACVRQERLTMQSKRRKGQRGRGRGDSQRRTRSQRAPDSPEVITDKRAARAAKRTSYRPVARTKRIKC